MLRDEAVPESDVDILIGFAAGAKSFDRLLALSELLEERLRRHVEIGYDRRALAVRRTADPRRGHEDSAGVRGGGGDASSLTVIGLSAGGLAGAVVTLGGTEFEGECDAPRNRPRVGLFVGLEGQYSGATERGGLSAAARERPDLARRLDPRSYLDRPTGARFVLFLGDRFAPAVAPAEVFLAALRASGVAAELRHVTGPHRASTFTQGVLDLLREVR